MEYPILDLEAMVGQEISGIIPTLHPTRISTFKLRGVRDAGIWIEYIELTKAVKYQYGIDDQPVKFVAFFPYSSITYLLMHEPDFSRPGELVEFPPAP